MPNEFFDCLMSYSTFIGLQPLSTQFKVIRTSATSFKVKHEMKEFEVLKQYHQVVHKLHELGLVINYREGEELHQLQLQIDERQHQKRELEAALIDHSNKQDSRATRQSMISQVSLYIQHIQNAHSGLLVSRSQGLVLENYFVGRIMQDVRWFLYHEPLLGNSIPNLYFTYESELGISRESVVSALRTELLYLEGLRPVDYISLLNFTEQMTSRLSERLSS
jgi:hypothetical protein